MVTGMEGYAGAGHGHATTITTMLSTYSPSISSGYYPSSPWITGPRGPQTPDLTPETLHGGTPRDAFVG